MIFFHASIFIIACLVLARSGSLIVQALTRIARFLGWREFVVASLLMAFTTSLPESFVGISSAFHQKANLSFSNIIGSNIAVLTLIVGLSALTAKKLKFEGKALQRCSFYAPFITSLPLVLMMDSRISRIDGIILLLTAAIYFRWLIGHQWHFTKIIANKNKDGKITGLVGIGRDITERKKMEDELRKLSRAVEQSDSTIVITNLNGDVEFANPAFTRITGYSLEEAIGQNTRLLSSGKHPASFYQELWETITKGETWQGEMINRKKDGSLYWEAATISPVYNEDGEITHYLAVKEDISKRKAIQKALTEEQQKSDALLKNMLPEKIANEIKETGSVNPVLFKNASILFTDFKNFTSTAEQLAPQELVDMINIYFTAFDDIIDKYNLEKLKTIGDSYMCAGGLPTPCDTHANDITQAAFDILAFVQSEKEKRQSQGLRSWDIRIGISSGPVIAGVVGQKKYTYDVWGDTVVMASRMEASGKIDKINISQSTYELIKEDFDCQYRGKVAAKHKGEVKMYFVNGAKPGKL